MKDMSQIRLEKKVKELEDRIKQLENIILMEDMFYEVCNKINKNDGENCNC